MPESKLLTLREAIASARWYSINRDGAATLCVDEEDALQVAAESSVAYPAGAPYTATRLISESALSARTKDHP